MLFLFACFTVFKYKWLTKRNSGAILESSGEKDFLKLVPWWLVKVKASSFPCSFLNITLLCYLFSLCYPHSWTRILLSLPLERIPVCELEETQPACHIGPGFFSHVLLSKELSGWAVQRDAAQRRPWCCNQTSRAAAVLPGGVCFTECCMGSSATASASSSLGGQVAWNMRNLWPAALVPAFVCPSVLFGLYRHPVLNSICVWSGYRAVLPKWTESNTCAQFWQCGRDDFQRHLHQK